MSLFILLVAVAKPCTRWHVSSNYYRNSTTSNIKCDHFLGLESSIVTGLDVCVRRLLILLLLPLIVLDLMDTELLRDAARARVFKGQARVVLQSRGDEDT